MGEWLELKTHVHDCPEKWDVEVGIGSRWQCKCGTVFTVTSCTRYGGEVIRNPYWILTWKAGNG